LIPMTCDHPAWSPRAARGVGRDPLRFRAAFTLSEAKGSE
ncbi:MAG: VapC toxin family PIN domain ribonuclease, partial [Roseiflexus castenholzii]